MTKVGRTWHAKHPMPYNPSLDQRIKWHLGHAKACGCRPMPNSILLELTTRLTRRRRDVRSRSA